jgi:prohibitin 2
LKYIYPWEQVESVSVRDVKYHQEYRCSSRDLQEVTVEMTVVYRRKKGKTPQIWRRVGQNSEAVDVAPGAQEVLKAITARHNATEIVQKRSKLSNDTKELLREWIADGDLELVDCSLAKSSFTPNFDTAIRAKQNALEDANKAVNQLAEAKERAKITRADALGDADAKIEDALGEAAKIRKSADAEAFEKRRGAEASVKEIRGVGLADALRLAKLVQALKLNPGVVELEAIKAWKGSVPQYKINTSKGDGINLLLPTPTPHKSAPPGNESE